MSMSDLIVQVAFFSFQTEEDRPLFRPFTRESLAQVEARIQEENEKKKELEKKRAEGEVRTIAPVMQHYLCHCTSYSYTRISNKTAFQVMKAHTVTNCTHPCTIERCVVCDLYSHACRHDMKPVLTWSYLQHFSPLLPPRKVGPAYVNTR